MTTLASPSQQPAAAPALLAVASGSMVHDALPFLAKFVDVNKVSFPDAAAYVVMLLCTSFCSAATWLVVVGTSTTEATRRYMMRLVGKRFPADAASFEICPPLMADVPELARLHAQDYVQCHRRLQGGAASKAPFAEWEEALGAIDFEDVVSCLPDVNEDGSGTEVTFPRMNEARQDLRCGKKCKTVEHEKAAAPSTAKVRLLKCVERSSIGSGGEKQPKLVGYVLYELREKGPRRSRQRYCELVNIVVRGEYRGCGAGRYLFEALRRDLEKTAVAEAGDLRLFVAERNIGPLAWYRRLGFVVAGSQTEHIGGVQVNFVRMVLRHSHRDEGLRS